MNSKRPIAIALALCLLLCACSAFAAGQKQVSDDQIYDGVKRKLANDPVVKGGALEVDVKAGVVTLRGMVEYDKQKVKAEKLARKVSGVKQVKNELTVGRRPAR